jgi:small GTP-binding protein
MSSNNETILKIIILGSSEVGKTSILNRYFNNEFSPNLLSTIGIDFKTKYFKFDDAKVKVNFIDTAGQEKFRAISVNYLKGTNGVVLTFDLTKKDTFDLIQGWIDDINQNVKADIGKILFGNKKDLENEREVLKEDAEQLAKELGCKYYEGSAKTGDNVTEALDECAKISYVTHKQFKESEPNDERNSIRLSGSSGSDKNSGSKKRCC